MTSKHLVNANRRLAVVLTHLTEGEVARDRTGAGVAVGNVELARTDHAFVLILPRRIRWRGRTPRPRTFLAVRAMSNT